jgi:NAD(P)-dependent dehydrogenase (short-subunit alcohol dehydrogenase family)
MTRGFSTDVHSDVYLHWGIFMSDQLRILLVGASGTLGSAVARELGARHKVISAGRSHAEIQLDIADPASILGAFEKAGQLDAVVCAAGAVAFVPLAQIKTAPIGESVHTLGLTNKLMGQVNLALAARDFLSDRGSITLTSGVLAEHPIAAGSSASMVNGAIDSFVRAAAVEMPRGIRINVVSPTVFAESMKDYGPFFRGFEPIPVARAALAFSRSVEGLETGKIYRVP